MHPIVIGTPTDDGRPLEIGALVTYHGRRQEHRHSVFYVACVDGADIHITYDIIDRDYPGVAALWGVSRQHITPTGRVVALCGECGHEAGRRPSHATIDICDAYPSCTCMFHLARDED